MKSTTAEATGKFRYIFSIEGAPKTLITDNGPPFNSTEFKEFSQPIYPQYDGQAEQAA